MRADWPAQDQLVAFVIENMTHAQMNQLLTILARGKQVPYTETADPVMSVRPFVRRHVGAEEAARYLARLKDRHEQGQPLIQMSR